ncbi:MAG: CCA tRNA nucleotidyltransferase [Actinomycetota bacterium]
MTEPFDGPTVRDVLTRVAPLAERFHGVGRRVHLVGGVVRDLLIGRPADDLDLTTDARPDETKRLVSGWADDVWSQGERFGTIGCRRGDDVFEITTYRAEDYDPTSRRPVVEFGDTLEGDLVRRDFTINAMALDPLDGSLVDPHGGRGDLAAGILRTPGPPDVSFDDDPLRMLRAARFVARFGLTPDDALLGSMRRHAPRLDIVSAERIHDELLKLLGGPDPAAGLGLLAEVGLLERFLPEAVVDDAVLARLRPDPLLRLAALVRQTDRDRLLRRARALRMSKDETSTLVRLVSVGSSALVHDAPFDDRAVRRLAVAAGTRLDEVRELVRAVDPHRGAAVDAAVDDLAAREDLHPDRVVDGAAVQRALGIAPGREIGEALRFLDQLRIEHGPLAEADQLARLREWWSARG